MVGMQWQRLVLVIAGVAVIVNVTVTGQQLLQSCRDCSLGGCSSIPRAEGGCPACICDGLLMPDCEQLNCTIPCTMELQLDGCESCSCPIANNNNAVQSEAVCPPIPACPSRCQVQLGGGCPRCTCPEELGPQCPLVVCPSYCKNVTGTDGCPACDCPPQDRICPEMPACPLGCIGQSDEPQFSGCLSCNCTLAEDLLVENEIDPTAPEEVATDYELITTIAIDPGLMDPTEANTIPGINDILATETNFNNPVTPNNIPHDPMMSEPGPNNVQPTSLLPNPFSPDLKNPSTDVTIPVAPRNRPNSPVNPPVSPNSENFPNERSKGRPTQLPSLNIPCGETSCPQGCTLCIQRNSCGRCLCGHLATVCPPVPACRPSCITSGPDGCFICSCPVSAASGPEGLDTQLGFGPILDQIFGPHAGIDFGPQIGIDPQVGPMVFSFNIGSEEALIPSEAFLRGGRPSNRPGPGRRVRPGNRGPTPGQLAVQRIPQGLLGMSRFQIFA